MPTTFVARQAEIARVRDLLGRVRAGRAGGVMLVGEAGIGKSRLLGEAARLGRECGFRVVSAACLPFVTPLPFEPVRALLGQLGVGAGPAEVAVESGVSEALFSRSVFTLEQAAAEQPLLLCLDDLHDSDAATLELVHYCVVRLADLPLAWVLAARPAGALTAMLHHLDRADLLERLELTPFSEREVGELALSLLDGAPLDGAAVAALSRRSGGNPFLCVELVRGLGDGANEAGADAIEGFVPAGVAEFVATRRTRLSEEAGRLLDWLAVLPEPASIDELLAVSRVEVGDVERELRSLREQRLTATAEGGSWRFVHALVRDAVYEAIPEGERVRRHSAAADALVGASLERRTPQLVAARRFEEAAAAHLELGDEALRRSGGADALSLYRRAGELAAMAGSVRIRRRATAGEALALLRVGAPADAHAAADRLLSELRASADDEFRLLFLARFALALHDDASDLASALSMLAEAEPLTGGVDDAVRAEAEYAQAFLLAMAGDPGRALPHAEAAVQAARAAGDVALEARALTRLGFVIGMARDSGYAMTVLHQAALLAAGASLPAETARAYLNLSYFADVAGDAEACAGYARDGLALSGIPAGIEVLLRGNLSNALADGGDLDGALAQQLAARASATRLEPRLEARILVGLAHVHIQRGELDLSRAALSSVDPAQGSFEHYRVLEQRALQLEEEQQLEEAFLAFEEGAAALDHPSALWCRVGTVRTAARLGRAADAHAAAAPLAAVRGRWHGTGWLHDEAAAFLAEVDGRADAAAELFERAAESCPSGFHQARLRLEAARMQRDRAGLSAAVDALEAMGARGLADRGRATMRSLGFRAGRRRRREGVLSEREYEVALLVAAGKTNAEIGLQLYLSARTVERHVGSILQKLGLRSRVELAAQAVAGRLPVSATALNSRASPHDARLLGA